MKSAALKAKRSAPDAGRYGTAFVKPALAGRIQPRRVALDHDWRTAARWVMALGVFVGGQSASRAFEASDLLAFRTGPLLVRPQLAETETYDDNILFRNANQLSDLVSTLSPGAKLSVGQPEIPGEPLQNNLTLEYRLDERLYLQNSQFDGLDQTLLFGGWVNERHLTWKGADDLMFLSSPLGGGLNIGEKVYRTAYDNSHTLEYDLSPKTGVYVTGSQSATEYRPGTPLYSINDWRGVVGADFKPRPKLRFLSEVYYGQTATSSEFVGGPHSPHSDFMGGFIGADGQFSERTSGELKLGYETREFSDHTPAPSSPAVKISLTHNFWTKSTATLEYTRQTAVSIQFARESYTSDRVSIGWEQGLGSRNKWRAKLNAAMVNYDYAVLGVGNSRHDQGYTAEAGLTYQIQLWLAARFNYQFEIYSSNTPGIIDYHLNRVILGVALGY